MSTTLPDKGYDPHDVEKRWYEYWEREQMFAAGERQDKQSYSIVIPPPNVTGVLHMGHALNNTLQDILCRYRRLRGDNVLWMPGTDHAGIATQNVVEKKLAGEGTDRHELGREKFIEAVWKWREEYGGAIINQLKRMGASCDWARERFTMDEGLSKAVREVFVQLYQEGLIYRGDYIINWCPRCHTALSDLEVEHEDQQGHLYYIKYPFVRGADGVVVATTRPETMLGDTAVAIHPEDERYGDLSVDEVVLPLMNRKIPIIRDRYVDRAFGTGGLKVTPAHDPNDFEIAQRHNLPSIKVIDDAGVMSAEAGLFAGMDRFECRKAVVKALKEADVLVKIEDYDHSVGHCYRCKTILEPNLSKQWFVSVKPLAAKAIEAVKTGRTRIIPSTWNSTYFDWMENIRDWCISRQIWWGHQIPAWTCEGCEKMTVAMETPETCPACGNGRLVQETDVLDTWFSSALWPFSTMGWPEQTELLQRYYPTSTLITGFDILFFWVARMMMMGIHFMGEVPFRDVYVHALVRDEAGKKMSKSKGNVIDPLTVIDTHGTDAFRYTLAAFAAQGRDIKMSEKRVEGYRHFINKLWNAARFVLMHIGRDSPQKPVHALSLPDRWIVSRFSRVVSEVAEGLEHYRFNDAAARLYQFVWHEYCDWYLEAVKPALFGNLGAARKETSRWVLGRILHDTLVLLHPFTPFVTEEIWHKLPGTEGSIMQAAFPMDDPDSFDGEPDEEAEKEMEALIGVISGVRNIRGEMNLSPSLKLETIVQTENEQLRRIIQSHEYLVVNLAALSSLSVEASGSAPKTAATTIIGDAAIFIPLTGIIDFAKESARLEKRMAKITTDMAALSKKLNNEDFLKKAPAQVVEKVKEKHRGLLEKQEKLQVHLEKIAAWG